MARPRGFRIGRTLLKVFRRCIHHRRRASPAAGPFSKLRSWVGWWRRGEKIHTGYIQVGKEQKRPKLPKGHLAVYVDDGDDDTCRVMVPVIYFNHPLFGELLREAEKVYGFDHPGGIQIPCPRSELESVQMRIAAATGAGIWRRRWSL